MGFSRQECWSGLPFPSPADLPHPGFGPISPPLADGFFTTEPPGKPQWNLEKVEFKARRGEKGTLWSLGSWHSAMPRPQALRVRWVRMVNNYSWVGQEWLITTICWDHFRVNFAVLHIILVSSQHSDIISPFFNFKRENGGPENLTQLGSKKVSIWTLAICLVWVWYFSLLEKRA